MSRIPNTDWNPTQDVEELKPYEVALGPELLDQVENLLRDLDMPPVKVGRSNQGCGSAFISSRSGSNLDPGL
jgi:hypothetical protein